MKLMNESPALSPLLPETCHYPLTPCSADAQIMSFEPISSRLKKKKKRLHKRKTPRSGLRMCLLGCCHGEGSEAMLPPDP